MSHVENSRLVECFNMFITSTYEVTFEDYYAKCLQCWLQSTNRFSTAMIRYPNWPGDISKTDKLVKPN